MSQANNYIIKLGLEGKEYEEPIEGRYLFHLDDSNEFSRIYTKLENDESLELQDADLSPKEKVSSITYSGDGIDISLKANFQTDTYFVIIEE